MKLDNFTTNELEWIETLLDSIEHLAHLYAALVAAELDVRAKAEDRDEIPDPDVRPYTPCM